MKKSCWLAIVLALLITSTLWGLVSAAGPPEDDPDQDSGRRVGLVSTEVKCLAVQSGVSDTASATVRLQWEGQVEEAFLVLVAAGSQGGHGIYINGQRVASVPVRPGGSLCRPGSQAQVLGPTDMIPIPIEALAKGENEITLTNDADVNDGWTAANLHIEIHGVLTGPPAAALEFTPPAQPGLDPTGTAAISGTVLLTSTYELSQGSVISQLVWYQIPAGYTGGVSVPLLIGIHGMGGTGEWIRGFLGTEADDRGWLLAAPDMHGNYYVNTGKYALAWPGAQHDIMDTVEYMMSQYEVDPLRIYIAGYSMGGQTTAMMAAKYPDVFAVAVPWKPLTDLTDWYYELEALGNPYNNLTVIERETAGTYDGAIPSEAPFEYQRRSPMEMPQNSRPIPIKMWHDVDDVLVPIHHSQDLKDAIDSWNPVTPVTLVEVPSGENDCPPVNERDFEHCYHPPPTDVLNFLGDFTLNADPPLSLTIRTDESKPYHWLNLAQTGGDHWSEVAAAYSLADRTVTATISDTQPLNLAFNLGSIPMMEGGIERPGMGLPSTTYLVKGGGNHGLEGYTSGYLVVPLTTVGQFTLTVSAIGVEASANPPRVAGGHIATSTITALAKDQLGNPVPDATMVEFSTTEGTFPNGRSTYITAATGGQATAILSLGPSASMAEVAASVEGVTGTTTVLVESVEIYLPIVTRML
jgi:pimeloyl-ACP methyl ester carboxylesterase